MRTTIIFAALLLLAGCVGTKSQRYSIEPITAGTSVRSSARTISVAKVNLPAYAKEPGIFVQDATGALVPVPKADWADDTERAMALAIVRNLGSITGARVALDPWPLGGVPEAEVRIEVEQMLVDQSRTMRLSGQFSIRRDIDTLRNAIGQFDIQTSAVSLAPADVVRAHAAAWRELASVLAKEL
ncbi:PqiC family protein [Rhizobiaceae bacterium]|nr:PqiC family protein [Rhizobiaceae bacterium]